MIPDLAAVAAEHAAIGRARDALESDRRELALREQREPILAQAIESAALVLGCCIPLVLLVLVLLAGGSPSPSEVASEQVFVELLEPSSQHTCDAPKRLADHLNTPS